jgi:hypothetical protein
VATPALLAAAAPLTNDGERIGLILATESRFRDQWLDLQAARLGDLGRRNEIGELCRQIDGLGAASKALRPRIGQTRLAPTPYTMTELALFGAPADGAAAAPGLLRVLGASAPLVEGEKGASTTTLEQVDRQDPAVNWIPGRLIQAPGVEDDGAGAVLSGIVGSKPTESSGRMSWVLETPWATLLAVLVFTQEAWAAERRGGLQLELAAQHLQGFARPAAVQVVVTLVDGREILCGTLGELCLRAIDAMSMAIVPILGVGELDQRLGPVVAELLRAGVWAWKPEVARYVIGEELSFDCYRGQGHRFIYLGSEKLSQVLRSVAVSWARERADGAGKGDAR